MGEIPGPRPKRQSGRGQTIWDQRTLYGFRHIGAISRDPASPPSSKRVVYAARGLGCILSPLILPFGVENLVGHTCVLNGRNAVAIKIESSASVLKCEDRLSVFSK